MPTPDERLASFDLVGRAAEALQRLKPQELRALWLKAQGHSYNEISALTGWSYTKVNRCLTEGRRSFLSRYANIESGAECARWLPVLSAMVDGEASARAAHGVAPAPAQLPGLPGDAEDAAGQLGAAGGGAAGPAAGRRAGGSADQLTNLDHARLRDRRRRISRARGVLVHEGADRRRGGVGREAGGRRGVRRGRGRRRIRDGRAQGAPYRGHDKPAKTAAAARPRRSCRRARRPPSRRPAAGPQGGAGKPM